MKRKILGIAVAILAMAMLAVPVMAKPTKGQKAAVIMRILRPASVHSMTI
jgi:hypothetical protein